MTSNFELEGVHVHVHVVKINLEQRFVHANSTMYKNVINMGFLSTSSKHYM